MPQTIPVADDGSYLELFLFHRNGKLQEGNFFWLDLSGQCDANSIFSEFVGPSPQGICFSGTEYAHRNSYVDGIPPESPFAGFL